MVRWHFMRKGQAAMEFLMTYGWAILVVLAAIGALAYFGVLSPDRFLPDKCVASPPFTCAEYKAANTTGYSWLTLRFQNNAGYDIKVFNVSLVKTQTGAGCFGWNDTNLPANGVMSNGESVSVRFNVSSGTGCTGLSGSKFKSDYQIIYMQADGTVNKTATGNVQVRVE